MLSWSDAVSVRWQVDCPTGLWQNDAIMQSREHDGRLLAVRDARRQADPPKIEKISTIFSHLVLFSQLRGRLQPKRQASFLALTLFFFPSCSQPAKPWQMGAPRPHIPKCSSNAEEKNELMWIYQWGTTTTAGCPPKRTLPSSAVPSFWGLSHLRDWQTVWGWEFCVGWGFHLWTNYECGHLVRQIRCFPPG